MTKSITNLLTPELSLYWGVPYSQQPRIDEGVEWREQGGGEVDCDELLGGCVGTTTCLTHPLTKRHTPAPLFISLARSSRNTLAITTSASLNRSGLLEARDCAVT